MGRPIHDRKGWPWNLNWCLPWAWALAAADSGKAFLTRAKYQTVWTNTPLNCSSERSALPWPGDRRVRIAVLVVTGVELLAQDAAVLGDLFGRLGRLGPGSLLAVVAALRSTLRTLRIPAITVETAGAARM